MSIADKAKKDVEELFVVEVEPLKSKKVIKHIVRGISPTGVRNEEAGTFPVEEVEEYVGMFLNAGFELVKVEHLERVKAPDQATIIGELMLYVLIGEIPVTE